MKLRNVAIVGVKQQSNGRSAKCGKLSQKWVLKKQLPEASYKKLQKCFFVQHKKLIYKIASISLYSAMEVIYDPNFHDFCSFSGLILVGNLRELMTETKFICKFCPKTLTRKSFSSGKSRRRRLWSAKVTNILY